ncbi:MAG: hypothetical protein A2146_01385 [Actinobacteria bacterium RBG_16_67_10]|nr:MAG: hypothetical protein A2146_01385 [Actinobacteria bacterium RBG_16_67_10]
MEDQRPAATGKKRKTPWPLILFSVLGVYAVLVALLNSDKVEVDFVFFSAEIRLLILILLCLVVGFGAGWVFEKMRARRKRGT